MIFAKAAAEIIKSSVAEGNLDAFRNPAFYGIVAVLVFAVVSQLHWCVRVCACASVIFRGVDLLALKV
jgi:hypothetical protein